MMSTSTPHSTRNAQLTSSGLGHHFVSPRKARDKRKAQTLVKIPGAEAKRRRLLAEMQQLMNPHCRESDSQLLPADPAHTAVRDDTTQHTGVDDVHPLHLEDVEIFEHSLDTPAVDMPVE